MYIIIYLYIYSIILRRPSLETPPFCHNTGAKSMKIGSPSRRTHSRETCTRELRGFVKSSLRN